MSSPGELIREVLEPVAAARGFDYDYEVLDPSPGRDAAPLHFVMCGARILLALTYADEFPSSSKLTAWRGARAVRRRMSDPLAGTAAVVLTQALAALLEEVTARAGEEPSAAIHRECAHLVQAAYPLAPELLARIDACRAEYNVIDTHEVREEVRIGVEIPTKYHLALMAPGEHWGSDPDSDPEAVAIQQGYAAQYLRGTATLLALEVLLGEEEFERLDSKLIHPGSLDPGVLVQRVSDQLLWNYASEPWIEYVELAFDDAVPEVS